MQATNLSNVMMATHIDIDIQDEQEAARILSLLNREHIPHRVQQKPILTDAEQAEARELIMRGSPGMELDAVLEHLRESREDRKMPFRDDE
ncbi:MAG: hypothetical protein H7Z72_09595 [Bacteroidetes bacterium]|nr:hypothetical protein [Fibrella sp.]